MHAAVIGTYRVSFEPRTLALLQKRDTFRSWARSPFDVFAKVVVSPEVP